MSFGIYASQGTGASGGSYGSAYAAAIMQDNPTLFLKFDETIGSTAAVDSSGNGHNASYVNSPYLYGYSVIPGSTGRSARFENGTGQTEPTQRVNVPYASWMDTAEMTVTFACFATAGDYRLIATRYGEPGNDWSRYVYALDDRFQFHYRSSGGVNTNVDSGVTIEQGKRYFVAVYVGAAGCGIRVYDESGLLGSATGAGGSVNPSSRSITLMNAETLGYGETGYLDGFAVFDAVLPTARLDQYGAYAMTPDAVTWINRSEGTLPRNGTTDHTISFTPASAGSLLVAVVGAAVTSDAVSAGWTKRVGVNYDTELSVFSGTANAGDAALAVAVSASNVPLHYAVYEFPSGSSWHSSATSTYSGVYPLLSGLPGVSTIVFSAVSTRRIAADTATPDVYWQYFWKTDMVQETPYDGVTTGVFTGIGYMPAYRQTSAQPMQYNEFIETDVAAGQRAVFALNIP